MCEKAPSTDVTVAARLTNVSLAVHASCRTSFSGHLSWYSCRRSCVSSTTMAMLSAMAPHSPCSSTRTACSSRVTTLPRLHSGFRMLTSVPAQRSMPHCCAA